MAGLVLSVVIGGGFVLVAQGDESTPVLDTIRTHQSPARAAQSLHAWVGSLADQSPGAVRGLAPSGDDEAADLLAAIARNAQALKLTDINARYVDQVGPVRDDGSWAATVALTWRISGFHARPAHTEVVVRFASDGRGGGIVGFGGEEPDGRRTPLWLQEPLSVVREPHLLVAAAGGPAQARRVADQVRHGSDVVSETIPGWEPSVVVQVPSTSEGLAAALGADAGAYAEAAAVTATEDGSTEGGAPTSIYLNPEWEVAARRDAQALMTHEIAHVATHAATSTTAPWLVEGFADVVALRGTQVPDAVLLRQAIALVRREGVPSRLPGNDDFETSAPELGAAYEMAWLACRIIAEHEGLGGLVALYESVASGTALTVALREIGLPLERLVEQWRTRLSDLAG